MRGEEHKAVLHPDQNAYTCNDCHAVACKPCIEEAVDFPVDVSDGTNNACVILFFHILNKKSPVRRVLDDFILFYGMPYY
jgi:hypothetical protein